MKLIDVLKALAVNGNLTVTLIDSDDNVLIKFLVTGYASVESDLGNRAVKKIKITSASTAEIVIGDVIEEVKPDDGSNTDSSTDPSDPGTDPSDPGTDPTDP